MTERLLSVAKDFSRFPGGRSRRDGPNSGEEFRDKVLIPALKAVADDPQGHVVVNLDGVAGYASSFLEEVFGGVIRTRVLPPQTIAQKLRIVSDDPVFAGFRSSATRYLEHAIANAT